MKLCDCGIQPDPISTLVEMAESQIMGQNCGQAFKFPYPRHMPVVQPRLGRGCHTIARCSMPDNSAKPLTLATTIDRLELAKARDNLSLLC